MHHTSITDLKKLVVAFLNRRVQNGEFTERGLARLLGVSQSQIHNVLKGARKMPAPLADHILSQFDMSALDLIGTEEIVEQLRRRGAIPASYGLGIGGGATARTLFKEPKEREAAT
ncbi:MAG: hypothetical protein JOY62_08505 [Acidobacteriaceae bacterium]|nr:hypothetical protein [Acidobacteriaceae bacterium]MBV9780002.1 hypothetical protein [Acidobacteriaceae bacterium]